MFTNKQYPEKSRHQRTYQTYEIAYTSVDLLAGLLFLIGSIFFFYEWLRYSGTWCFVIGSVLFVTRPSIRFVRELHLARLPDPDEHSHSSADGA